QYNSDAPSSLNLTFTLVELKGVLNHVKDSAPGEDGIPYSFLSHLGEKGLNYFLNLINKILLTGDIPPSWRSHIVLPFLKPSKVQSDIKSYRPIVLSSVITKVVEHLIKNRLEWYIENNEYLSQTQFGFRKGKSVGDNLGILVTDIRNAFSDKKSVVAAFLDINSAYDNVLLHILKSKLDKLKVPYFLTNSIVNLLSERTIILDVGGPYKPSRLVWRGLPQGSVLSPLLYNIYTYDLEGSVGDSASLLQYADDLVIYASDMSVSTAERYVSSSLSLL
ncbi:reverse transcriptase family protein, partial [Pseudomonas aeruginosa]